MAAIGEKPLVVIVGPTASGKSGIAMELAEQLGGEIICADSRTVYKHMDIGTAKPTREDQARVPHWGLNLVEPNEPFSAADFKVYAEQKIDEIRSRGRVPFLVGGTGLYIDGVIFDYQYGPAANKAQRSLLESMTLDELHAYCAENNIVLPKNEKNRRYVIRAIEQKSINTKRLNQPIQNCIIVGITTNKETLTQHIHDRSEQLFENGVIDEARSLGERYGWKSEAMTGNVYRIVHDFIDGKVDETEMKTRNETSDWQLAKRQLTWFKRNPFVTWLPLERVSKCVLDQLA